MNIELQVKLWKHGSAKSSLCCLPGLRQKRDPTWFGVEVIGEAAPGKAQCKCLNCGHERVLGSMAAKRELSAIAYQQARMLLRITA